MRAFIRRSSYRHEEPTKSEFWVDFIIMIISITIILGWLIIYYHGIKGLKIIPWFGWVLFALMFINLIYKAKIVFGKAKSVISGNMKPALPCNRNRFKNMR